MQARIWAESVIGHRGCAPMSLGTGHTGSKPTRGRTSVLGLMVGQDCGLCRAKILDKNGNLSVRAQYFWKNLVKIRKFVNACLRMYPLH